MGTNRDKFKQLNKKNHRILQKQTDKARETKQQKTSEHKSKFNTDVLTKPMRADSYR